MKWDNLHLAQSDRAQIAFAINEFRHALALLWRIHAVQRTIGCPRSIENLYCKVRNQRKCENNNRRALSHQYPNEELMEVNEQIEANNRTVFLTERHLAENRKRIDFMISRPSIEHSDSFGLFTRRKLANSNFEPFFLSSILARHQLTGILRWPRHRGLSHFVRPLILCALCAVCIRNFELN